MQSWWFAASWASSSLYFPFAQTLQESPSCLVKSWLSSSLYFPAGQTVQSLGWSCKKAVMSEANREKGQDEGRERSERGKDCQL